MRAIKGLRLAAFPVGFNITSDSYYDGAGKHSNVLVESAATVPANTTALGFPKAGLAVTYLIFWTNNYLWQQYKAGTYVIKGTATGATLTVSGSNAAAPVASSGCTVAGSTITPTGGAFKATVAISALTAPTGDGLILYPKPASFALAVSAGGASDMTDLVVCHSDDEAHQAVGDAASYFTLDAIADYSTASHGPLRTMQWQQMVNVFMQDVADIPADKMIGIPNGWAVNNSLDGSRGTFSISSLPSPEMLGRFATACGMSLWVTLHPMMTDACMAAYLTRIASTYPSGSIYIELGNEPWNSAYWAINSSYLGSIYPTAGQPGFGRAGVAAGTSQLAVNDSLGHASLRAWKQAGLVFGGRVKRAMNVQLTWADNSISSLDYVDSTNLVGSGGTQKVGQLMDSACCGAYVFMTPDHRLDGATVTRLGVTVPGFDIRMSARWRVQNYTSFTTSFCEKAWRNGIDQCVYYIGLWQTRLTSLGYKPMLWEYEGHQIDDSIGPIQLAENVVNGDGVTPAGDPKICMAYTAATGAMVPANGTVNGLAYTDAAQTLTNWFTNGDIIQVSFTNGLSGGPQLYTSYKGKIISGALYAFDSGANYTTGLGAQLTGNVDATILVVNVSKFALLAEQVNAAWWSNPSTIDGQTIVDYMHTQYRAAGLTLTAGFKCLGSAYHPFYTANGGQSFMQTSANKPHGHWYPDTALATRYKALT